MSDSKKIAFDPPRGMRDFYPEEMAVRNLIFDSWRRAASEFGFVQYDSCVVENLGLFKQKSGEEIVDQIYDFTDKSGRELALRPEMTPTLARMIAARQGGMSFPVKWFAIAQCFRYERMSKGRKREHYQWNLDIIGENSVLAETEVIACALKSLSLMGFGADDARVLFSNRALLAALLEKSGIRKEHHHATFLALDKRGKQDDEQIARLLKDEGLADGDINAVFELMRIESFEQAAEMTGADSEAVRKTRQFMEFISACGLSKLVNFDISIVRGLGYYTGIVFEAFDAQRELRALFGGGRYDNLLSELGGTPATAVGLGFGDVVVAELLARLDLADRTASTVDMAIGYMTENEQHLALRAANKFRAEGVSVDLGLSPEKAKKFFSRAGKGGYLKAVYLGPDDAAGGTMRIKNLRNKTEETMDMP